MSWMINRLRSTLNNHLFTNCISRLGKKRGLIILFLSKANVCTFLSGEHNLATDAFSRLWKMHWIHFALLRFWTALILFTRWPFSSDIMLRMESCRLQGSINVGNPPNCYHFITFQIRYKLKSWWTMNIWRESEPRFEVISHIYKNLLALQNHFLTNFTVWLHPMCFTSRLK